MTHIYCIQYVSMVVVVVDSVIGFTYCDIIVTLPICHLMDL